MRRRARVDSIHAAIVKRFRELHCTVIDLSRVGQGCPDLLVGRNGNDRLVEIKDGARPPSQRRLTEQQTRFHALWNGRPVATVMSLDDVESIANALYESRHCYAK